MYISKEIFSFNFNKIFLRKTITKKNKIGWSTNKQNKTKGIKTKLTGKDIKQKIAKNKMNEGIQENWKIRL